METRLFHIFLAVVHHGSFAGAARSLDIDPSIVSRAISHLEADLGARLFHRSTRSIALTEAGDRFRGRIGPVSDELDQIRDEIRSNAKTLEGALCVSSSVAFGQTCIIPVLHGFKALYPALDIRLNFTDQNVDLVKDRVDVAIRLAPSLDLDVVVTKLMDTRYHLYAAPNYLATAAPIAAPSDLKAHQTICFDLPEFRTRWLMKAPSGGVTEVPIAPSLVISSALGVKSAAMEGLGIAMLADWLARDAVQDGSLVPVLDAHQATATDFETAAWLIYPSRSFLPRKTRAFIDYFKTAWSNTAYAVKTPN